MKAHLSSPVIRVGVLLAALTAGSVLSAETPSPQPQQALEPMLQITWKRGPNLPQGFQDSAAGLLGDHLLLVGGFCSGTDSRMKPGVYPRGFLKKGWVFDLNQSEKGWTSLPDFPGVARQGLLGAPVKGALYCWGGINYTNPYAYNDGYRLSQKQGPWIWEELPPLPHPLYCSGVCVIGTKIYLLGGADYDSEHFYIQTDRAGKNKRLGAQLWVFDADNMKDGWKRLAECPGTARFTPGWAAVDGKVFVIGGATELLGTYCTVVDNWVYEPPTDKWTRLRDLPVSSGNFWAGNIVYKNRYLLLLGGAQYDKVANPDGTTRAKYGKPSKLDGQGAYFNDVFVYDTMTDLFGTADRLPINNNTPMTVVRGDEVFALGGECDARQIEGEYYGHHPDLFLRGRIRAINP